MHRRKQTMALAVAAAVWLAGIAGGYQAMWRFQRKAGDAGVAPKMWPPDSRLQPSAEGATLVLFAHPRCPCTRASITELRELLGSRLGRIRKTYVLVLKPSGFPNGWELRPE